MRKMKPPDSLGNCPGRRSVTFTERQLEAETPDGDISPGSHIGIERRTEEDEIAKSDLGETDDGSTLCGDSRRLAFHIDCTNTTLEG